MKYLKSLRLNRTEVKNLEKLGFIVELNTNCRMTQKHCLYDIFVVEVA